MDYGVSSWVLAEQPTAVMRMEVPLEEVAAWLPSAYGQVLRYLAGVHVSPAGPPFARYDFTGDRAAVEAGFPVPTPVVGDGRVVPSSLPGGSVAVVTHYGPYEELAGAYDAVAAWLKEHGHEADGPHWEVYYTDPQAEPDPAHWRTDLVAPYRTPQPECPG